MGTKSQVTNRKSQMDPIRFGIIGFGLHAMKRLMPAFARAQRSKVVALSRRDAGRARESAEHYGIPHAFTSAAELCRRADVEAVFIATPNSVHLSDVLTAAEHRKPMLLEKPMAMNAAECRQMIEAARRAGVVLGIAHVFRFHNSVNRIRELLAEGAIGDLVFARSEFSFPGRGHVRTWLNDAAIAGGGPIMDIGVHCVDALRYMLRDEIAEVSALTRRDAESRDVEAAAALSLRLSSGALAAVLVSYRAAYRTPLELVGESGVLRANNAFSVEEPITIELLRAGKPEHREELNNFDSYTRQLDAFADAIGGAAPFPVLGEEGLRNQLVLDAAFESARTGKTVRIAD
jgi:predicted dehydrogenase